MAYGPVEMTVWFSAIWMVAAVNVFSRYTREMK